MSPPSNTYVSRINGIAPSRMFNGSAVSTFTWPYSHPNGVVLAKFQMRRDDGVNVRYWRESDSTWQASAATMNTLPLGDLAANADATYTLTMPSGAWTNGTGYSVSVLLEDANGEQSTHDNQVSILAGVGPSVNTITSPSAPSTTNRPDVTWTVTLGSISIGAQQWQVKIYDLGVVASPDPDVTAAQHESGIQFSSVFTWSLVTEGISLPNGSYRVYVRVASATLDGGWSAWTLKNFTVAAGAFLNPPGLTASSQPTNGRVLLTVQGHENMLPKDDSDIEAGVGQWTGDSSTTASQSSAQKKSGTNSLRLLRNTTTGTAGASRTTGTSGVPVTVGVSYVALASFRAGTTGRSCTVIIEWYTSGGSLVTTSTSTPVSDTNAGFTDATLTATAPATAAFARLRVAVASAVATEVHYVDELGIFPAGLTAWSMGGLTPGNSSVIFERSLDGGVSWARHRWYGAYPSDPQAVALADWEAPPSVETRYRAFTEAQVSGIGFVQSAYTTVAMVSPVPTSWWLKSITSFPTGSADGVAVRAAPGARRNVPSGSTRFDPVDAAGAVIVYDAYAPSPDHEVTLTTLSKAEFDALVLLLDGRVVLLLQGALRQWYVRPVETRGEEQLRAKPVAGEVSPVRHAHKVTCRFVEVPVPAI